MPDNRYRQAAPSLFYGMAHPVHPAPSRAPIRPRAGSEPDKIKAQTPKKQSSNLVFQNFFTIFVANNSYRT